MLQKTSDPYSSFLNTECFFSNTGKETNADISAFLYRVTHKLYVHVYIIAGKQNSGKRSFTTFSSTPKLLSGYQLNLPISIQSTNTDHLPPKPPLRSVQLFRLLRSYANRPIFPNVFQKFLTASVQQSDFI